MLQRVHKSLDERDEGFTLIELLIAMIIIGILAAIAIPVFLNQRNKGYEKTAQSDARNVATAEKAWAGANGGKYTASVPALAANFKPSSGVVLTVAVNGDVADHFVITSKAQNDTIFCYDSKASDKAAYKSDVACPAAT